MRLKKQIGKKWLVYSFSATGNKMNSLPDFENWFQVQTPLGNTMHVKKRRYRAYRFAGNTHDYREHLGNHGGIRRQD